MQLDIKAGKYGELAQFNEWQSEYGNKLSVSLYKALVLGHGYLSDPEPSSSLLTKVTGSLLSFTPFGAVGALIGAARHGNIGAAAVATLSLGFELGGLASLGEVGVTVEGGTTALAPYWPRNGGALGEWANVMAKEGQILDRYGSIYGSYASPIGTPFGMRALSPTTNVADYFQFQVLKPFPMESSTIAPAFGQLGLGMQYQTPIGINYLQELGYIKIIK